MKMVGGQTETQAQDKSFIPVEDYFTRGQNPYHALRYKKVNLRITDEGGKHLFTQKNSEFPEFFSQAERSSDSPYQCA